MKKQTTLVIITLLLFFTSCVQNSYDDRIREIAKDNNRNLPVMINSSIRFDNVRALSGHVYQYNYTYVKVENKYFDKNKTYSLIKSQKKEIAKGLSSFRRKSGFQFFITNNVTFEYQYKDKNGVLLYKIIFTPNELRKL